MNESFSKGYSLRGLEGFHATLLKSGTFRGATGSDIEKGFFRTGCPCVNECHRLSAEISPSLVQRCSRRLEFANAFFGGNSQAHGTYPHPTRKVIAALESRRPHGPKYDSPAQRAGSPISKKIVRPEGPRASATNHAATILVNFLRHRLPAGLAIWNGPDLIGTFASAKRLAIEKEPPLPPLLRPAGQRRGVACLSASTFPSLAAPRRR